MHGRAWLVALVVLSGCAVPRVSLRPVPPKDASLEERTRAWRALLPHRGLMMVEHTQGVRSGAHLTSITLHDGTRVVDPRDLAPAVEPTSPVLVYAEDWARKSETASTLSVVQLLMFTVGVAAILGAVFAPEPPNVTPGQPTYRTVLGIGGLASVALQGVPALISRVVSNNANNDRTAAFHAYPSSLAERLGFDPTLVDPIYMEPTKPQR